MSVAPSKVAKAKSCVTVAIVIDNGLPLVVYAIDN